MPLAYSTILRATRNRLSWSGFPFRRSPCASAFASTSRRSRYGGLGASEVELKRMYLRPRLRGRGVGRKLLQTALAWAREHAIGRIALDTSERMQAAQHLYEAHGFVRVDGDAPRQGQPRLLYELRLSEPT